MTPEDHGTIIMVNVHGNYPQPNCGIMRKRNFCLLVIAAVAILTSCQKELSNESGVTPGTDSTTTPPPPVDSTTPPPPADSTPTNTNTEVGTWKFISIHGTIAQTTEFSQASIAVKAISNSDYTTENNGGTVTFDGSTMTTNAVTFTINTTANTDIYYNGALFNSVPLPLNTTVPPQTSSATYKKIGTDSLYFPNGGLIDLGSGGVLPAIPSGCKLTFNGNTMTINAVYDDVSNETNQQGVPQKVTSHAVLVITLQKQ
jgi:hypothetical protein